MLHVKVWKVLGRTPQHEAYFLTYCPTKADAIKERTAWLKYHSWEYVEVWFEETEITEQEYIRYCCPVGVGF